MEKKDTPSVSPLQMNLSWGRFESKTAMQLECELERRFTVHPAEPDGQQNDS